jgi:ABC-type branched-subunit amino acid transport system ATPase component
VSASIVSARGLTVGYGKQPVVFDLDLEVHPGEVVALLGPNGAGKTTTLLTLAGELAPMAGEVIFDGKPTKAPLHRRARNGLGFVTEERSVFMGLSTTDNLRAGRIDPEEALELFPELRTRLGVRGGLLSGRVLLADELSLGLAPLIVRRLLQAVRDAASRGCGVLLVEQHVRQALEFADRAYVMRRGRIELTGGAAELGSRLGEIEETYLTSAAAQGDGVHVNGPRRAGG